MEDYKSENLYKRVLAGKFMFKVIKQDPVLFAVTISETNSAAIRLIHLLIKKGLTKIDNVEASLKLLK